MAPIIASQNQEENDNDGDSSIRAQKFTIISLITSLIFFLGIFFFIGRSSFFSFPSIYIIIIFIILFRVIFVSRSRSRGRSQNYSQRQRRETYPLEHKTPTVKRNQKYCLQCGSEVDRNIDNLSVYYCSHCGYEIKNVRGKL